jgi:hypothetical protein
MIVNHHNALLELRPGIQAGDVDAVAARDFID